jgi:hypothetical protein
VRLALPCLLTLLAATLAAAQPVPVANGDFEQGLQGWSLIQPDGYAHGDLKLETADVHGGKNAVRITNTPGQGRTLVGLFQAAPIVLPSKPRTFALTAWMKSVVAPESVELRVASTGKSGQALTPWQEHGWRFFRRRWSSTRASGTRSAASSARRRTGVASSSHTGSRVPAPTSSLTTSK